jgi:hypothetical protein
MFYCLARRDVKEIPEKEKSFSESVVRRPTRAVARPNASATEGFLGVFRVDSLITVECRGGDDVGLPGEE